MGERFIVGFRGEFSDDEQRALRDAGFDVLPNAIQSSDAYSPDAGEVPPEWRNRHVVRLDADSRQDAEDKVADVMRRELPDLLVAP